MRFVPGLDPLRGLRQFNLDMKIQVYRVALHALSGHPEAAVSDYLETSTPYLTKKEKILLRRGARTYH
ncbi:hypothetical protein [Photobacterium indicum]|uniref:hypothetical protein n=1 Tax=Photobacterium indicum TaxID=81447 RepID=UPI003D12D1C4